jgi:hypothetical protein
MAVPRGRAALPCLLVAALLLACATSAAGLLPVAAIAGQATTLGANTATFAGQLGLSVALPNIITRLAVDLNSGVVYLACVNQNLGASTVIAAEPTGQATFTLTTVAGNYASSASTDGVGTAASFQVLNGLAVDGCVRAGARACWCRCAGRCMCLTCITQLLAREGVATSTSATAPPGTYGN